MQANQHAPSGPQATAPALELAPALDRLAGMHSLYTSLAREYLEELDTVGLRYRSLLGAGERVDAMRLMHSLKGSSATLGATRLAHTAATLEMLCKCSTDNAAPMAQAGTLDLAIEATRTALRATIDELQRTTGNDPS